MLYKWGDIQMTELEKLENEARNERIDIISYHFSSNRLKGLYCNNTIALSKKLKSNKERACILAEELGHYHTSYGNIINQNITENRKQEQRARIWSYDRLIGLHGIIKMCESNCKSLHECAELLDITEEFLIEALAFYRNKYGQSVKYNNYVIYFEPSLGILKII